MAELKLVGPLASADNDISTRGYVTQATSTDMSASEIDSRVTDLLTVYSTKAYADTQDALNATSAYVDAGDATRLKLIQKDAVSGVAALDSSGRANRNLINTASGQRYPKGLWTPGSYGSPVTATSGETALFSESISDPGYPYRLVVQGTLSGLSGIEGAAPVVVVRAGNATTGQIVARGVGSTESYNYLGIDTFGRETSSGLGGDGYWIERAETGMNEGVGTGYARCTGGVATWVPVAADANWLQFQRGGNDASTIDDYQEINLWMGSVPSALATTGTNGSVRLYGRMNSGGTHWVAFDTTAIRTRLLYRNGGATVEVPGTGTNITASPTDQWTGRFGTTSGKRWFQLLQNSSTRINWQDTGNVTAMDGAHRGWGFGMGAGWDTFFGVAYYQMPPGDVSQVTITDTVPGGDTNSYCPVVLMPYQVANQTVMTGPTTLYYRLAASALVGAGYNHTPNVSVLAVPA